MSKMNFGFKTHVFKVLLFALIVGYCLGIAALTISTYTQNFRGSEGFVLSDGKPVGGDFICFYAAGKLVKENISTLYDYPTQFARQRKVLEGRNADLGLYQFIYPPLMAFLFSLFASLPFVSAYWVWTIFSITLYLIGLIVILKTLSLGWKLNSLFLIASLSFVPFSIDCLAGGQTSCIGFFIYAVMFSLLKSDRDMWAGIVLAFGYYKPPLFVVFVFILILSGRWKALVSCCLTFSLLVALSYFSVGRDVFVQYLQKASSNVYGREIVSGYMIPVEKGVSLFPFCLQIAPRTAPFLTTFVFLLCSLALFCFRVFGKERILLKKGRVFNVAYAAAVSVSLFLSPYMMIYDLTILMVPMLIACSSVVTGRMRRSGAAILCVAIGFMLEFLKRTIRLPFATIQTPALLLLVWVVCLVWFFWKEAKLDAHENNA